MSTIKTAKRIAPAAYDALVEALSAIYWYKRPFERFLRTELRNHPELLGGLSFSEPKRQVASDLVLRLAREEDRYQAVTLELMETVAATTEFPDLRTHPDAAVTLIAKAKIAVEDLRRLLAPYTELAAAQERLEAERAAEAEAREHRSSFSSALQRLKADFVTLASEADHQARGRQLEALLNGLFHLYDLNPRKSFYLKDEQIDGAFTYNTDDYILEAKWEQSPASRRDADVLSAMVGRKGKNTLCLFVAVAGFSGPAVSAHSDCGTGMVFLDGADLFSILDERLSLTEVLDRKRRHLAETGEPYFSSRKMLND
jgi:hypothetical protein